MTGEVQARSPREAALLRRISRLGLSIQYVGNKGAVLVRGRGVDVMTATLGWLDFDDLTPPERKTRTSR